MEKVIRLAIVVFIYLCLQPLFLLTCLAAQEGEEETKLNLYAQSAVLMDADSGRILYGKNENQIMSMASTTKIMTCKVALEKDN